MPSPSDFFKAGALRAIDPVVGFLARHNVSPNSITTVGTILTVVAGIVYGTGHIMTAGWIMASTAFFDVLDGEVARRTNRSSVFGAFYDSTLDRVADGALLGGLVVFYATSERYGNDVLLVITLLSAPQALFGLALEGWVLAGIVTLLSVTAWVTAIQRIQFVYRTTSRGE